MTALWALLTIFAAAVIIYDGYRTILAKLDAILKAIRENEKYE